MPEISLPVQQKKEVVIEKEKPITDPQEIMALVQQTFADHPIMVVVALCESDMNGDGLPEQFNPDGSLLYNKKGSSAHGVFQIMESYHHEDALELGYDTHTTRGNVAYAHHLFTEDGIGHWNASSECWLGRTFASVPE